MMDLTTRIFFLLRKYGFNQGRFGSEKQLDTKKMWILTIFLENRHRNQKNWDSIPKKEKNLV